MSAPVLGAPRPLKRSRSLRAAEPPSTDARREPLAQPAARSAAATSQNLARGVWRRVGGAFGASGRCAAEPLARTRASAALAALYSEPAISSTVACSKRDVGLRDVLVTAAA